MNVVLPQAKEIVLVPEKTITTPARTKTVSGFTIIYNADYPTEKKVYCFTEELGRILLWEGAEYDAAGQWTDDDVKNRLIALYS